MEEQQFEDQRFGKPHLSRPKCVPALCSPKGWPSHTCTSLGDAWVSAVAMTGLQWQDQFRTVKRGRTSPMSQSRTPK